MKKLCLLLIGLISLCLSAAAHAVEISNCDKVPHNLALDESGDQHIVTLEPGKSVSSSAAMLQAGLDGSKPINIDREYDYCINKNSIDVQGLNALGHRLRK